ncbi:PH domain-containing protein [Natronospira bacteriovora]|uniref:PH domain-containing protein n=1 Tax=Natronospira bacteriovora TaxID=3069753 RepID=A0ABU0WA88_9GAMM|nr:PH domain-containing protein [Natronospira sp. AB-CW4]MDQ2070829.1 PH domain-containing protein [Natronospira sp. AB-CW4]
MERQYRSKMDAWIVLVLLGSALVCLWAGGVLLIESEGDKLVIALLIAAVGAGLPLWMLLDTVYVIDQDMIRVHNGPFRWKVPLANIQSVKRERTILAGPALSMDRIVIQYGRWKMLIISPRDPETFIAELENRRASLSPSVS